MAVRIWPKQFLDMASDRRSSSIKIRTNELAHQSRASMRTGNVSDSRSQEGMRCVAALVAEFSRDSVPVDRLLPENGLDCMT